MFSSIKDAIFERTNRIRDSQHKKDHDHGDFVIVNEPRDGSPQVEVEIEPPNQGSRLEDGSSSDDSSGSRHSISSSLTSASQLDPAHRAWKFMQCGSDIPGTEILTCYD